MGICTQLDDSNHAHEIAGKIVHEMTKPISVGGRDHCVGASIGVSLYPAHGDLLARLLDYADPTLYQVKSSGKNGYRIHEAADAAQGGA